MNEEARSTVDGGDLLERLATAARAITSRAANRPFEEIVAAIVAEAAHAVRAHRAAAWLERGDAIEVIASTGLRPTTVDRFQHLVVPAGTPGEAALRRQSALVWTTHEEAKAHFPLVAVDAFGAGVAMPIGIATTTSGVLFVGWQDEHHQIGRAELSFLEAAAHFCALAIERVDLARARQNGEDGRRHEIVHVDELFSVATTTTADEVVVSICGEIDLSNIDQFERIIAWPARELGVRPLAIDLVGVQFVSVAAARLIVGLVVRATQAGLPAEVRNTPPVIGRVLDIAGLAPSANPGAAPTVTP